MKEVASQLIKKMREPLSQEQFNRKLGSKSNQAYRWEKGHAKVEWSDFIKVAKVAGVDFKTLFQSYFRYSGSLSKLSGFFEHLFTGQSLRSLSKKVEISESKLRRLVKGQSGVTLDDFLQIIFALDAMESMAFVHELSKGKSIPALAEEKRRMDKIVKAYYKHPELGLLLTCLNLPGYQNLSFHRDSFLAELCGMEIVEVDKLLKLTLELGLTEKVEGKYTLTPFKMSDRGSKAEMMKVRSFWTKKALVKQQNSSVEDAFGSIIFTTSKKSREKIIASYLRFFEEFKEIVEKDKAPHEIPLVMNFHLFTPGKED